VGALSEENSWLQDRKYRVGTSRVRGRKNKAEIASMGEGKCRQTMKKERQGYRKRIKGKPSTGLKKVHVSERRGRKGRSLEKPLGTEQRAVLPKPKKRKRCRVSGKKPLRG